MGEKTREHTKPVVKPIAELCVRDLLGRESLEDLSRGYRRHDGQLSFQKARRYLDAVKANDYVFFKI